MPFLTLDMARPPEWTGWAALGLLVVAFSLLAWWLLFSPLSRPAARRSLRDRRAGIRRTMALLVLLGNALMSLGGRWDELWHRAYGLPFGEDLLWPPHLLMYASLALTCFFAAFGMRVVLAAEGSVRERFRAEPLLGMLGLLAAYQLASIPSDVLWHQIIGPDLSAASLPHVVMVLSITSVCLVGAALAMSAVSFSSRRAALWRPRGAEWVAVGLVAVATLNWLQLFTTEWEWAQTRALGGSEWHYPVVVLLIGAGSAHLILHTTRRVGAATAAALVALLVHAATVAVYRFTLPPGPVLAAHLLLVPPAVALDAWYAVRTPDGHSSRTRWGGALLYAGVFFAVAFPFIAHGPPFLTIGWPGRLTAIAVGLPASLAAGIVAAGLGGWLRSASTNGRQQRQGLTAHLVNAVDARP